MSLKKIICDSSQKSEKGKTKIVNTNETTHRRISMLSGLFGVTNTQVLNNIVLSFFRDNEEEIKDRIAIKRNELDEMF